MAQPASAAPPGNDNFANATTITGTTGSIAGTTVDSTGETGEPVLFSQTTIKSIWYSWVAPNANPISFDTCASSDFDTTLGVFTGTAVNNLTLVVSSDQATAICAGTDQSRVLFTPTAGTTYKIKIDGYFGESGPTVLTWSVPAAPPANDNFVNAIALTGTTGTVSGTNVNATGQTGEPINGEGPIHSVWYKYTPTTAGTLTVGVCATTSFDSAIGMYTGASVGALTTVATDDDGCGITFGPSRITNQAVASGTTYNISIDGYDGQTTAFTLAFTFTPGAVVPPANDNFANAVTLPGASGSVNGTTINATGETGEPRVAGTGPTRSVWYTWTAPATGNATFGLCTGTTYDTIMGAYTGTAVNALTSRASADDTTGCGSGSQSRFTLAATAGTVYKIQVDGYNGASGAFTLTYSLAVPLTLAINDVTLNEGNSGTTSFDFTVTLSAAAASNVTVQYATANGTATAPADYASASGTLTFTPGQLTKTISVPVVGDVTFEPNETFVVNLSAPVGATIADNQGSGTITNDDSQPAVSIGDVTQAEGNSGTTTFAFPVTLSNPSSTPVTMTYATVDGTATSPSDYAANSGTVTFAAGETAKTVSVAVSGDTVFESNETFRVVLAGVAGGTLLDDQAVGTISNDDAAPTITIDDVTHAEGDSGTTSYTFTVTLSNAAGDPVTVDYATADGTASSPADFTAANGTLTFAPGQTTKTVTVLVNGDTAYETDEDFSATLSNASGAGIADSTGTGTVTNDDAPPTLDIDDVTATEGDGGTTSFDFTVTLTGATELPVTVHYATADGTATAPADYAATAGNLQFLPGETTATISVQVAGDDIDELAEAFAVTLTNGVGATVVDGQGDGTIVDDDPQPAISIDDVSQIELDNGDTSTFDFTVALTNPSSRTVTVEYTTSDGTATAPADYVAATGTVTFAPGDTTQTVSVTVNGDNQDEGNQTFFVDLSDPVQASIADNRGVGTILNDENQPTVAIDDVTQTEGDSGNTAFTFNVTLSGPTALVTTVNYETNNGSATAPDDFNNTNGTLTFTPGQTSRPVTVQVHGDTTYEDDEDFTVQLSAAVGATIGDATGLGTIVNDDALPSLAVANTGAAEGDTGTTPFGFAVTLTNPSENAITVDYTTVDGTATSPADFAATTGTLTFTPGQTAKTITVPVVGDTTYELNETFSVQLSGATNVTVADGTANGSIQNDDAPPVLAVSDVSHLEGDGGTTSYAFTVSLAGATALPVTVDYATADGSATAPGDYAGATGTLTFAPGETTKTVTIQVNGDVVFEPTEAFTLVLSGAAGATIGDASGTGTITNDDTQPTISIGNESQGEGDAGTKTFTFDLTLSGPSSQTVTVEYTTTDGTATSPSDFTATSGTVTFTPGQLAKTVTVTVKGDVVFEADESFTVDLSAPNNATIADGSGSGTIVNDDAAPVITIADISVTESNSGLKAAVFNLSLSNPSAQTVVVDYVTSSGSATPGSDYVTTNGTVVFAAGQTTQTLTVGVNGDTTFEPDETFGVTLSNPVRGSIGDGAATGTITNDDAQPTVSIAGNASVTEGNSGTNSVNIPVTLTNASYQTVTVAATTSNGTAVAPGDYTAGTTTVTFAPGQTTGTATVIVKGDTTFETNELFSVDLGAPTNTAGISSGHADVTITNDDAAPTLSIADDARPEGNTGTTNFGFVVTLTGATEVDATFGYTTVNGSATAPADFTAVSGTGTIRAGDLTTTINVAVVGDTVVEPNEVFTVALSAPQGATFTDSSATGTIQNDDIATDCTITGTAAGETLTGTANPDVICAGDGDDIINGLGGNDILRGQGGNDTITGGAGNDTIDGGSGTNTVSYDSDPTGVTVILTTGSATDGFGGTDTLTSVSTVRGSAFADTLDGTSSADRLFGLGGADRIGGRAGDDLINGGAGNDQANGGGGTDSCPQVEQSRKCEGPAAAAAESGVLGLYDLLGHTPGSID